MTERAIVVPVEGPLGWRGFDIPDGSHPIELAELRFDSATRATTSMARFPEGWERPSAGSYTSAEEFVVLEGELLLNGEKYGPGDWARVPRHAIRRDTAATSNVLALVRFDGPALWLPGAGEELPVERAATASDGSEQTSPFGGPARLLRDGRDASAWVVDHVPSAARAPVDAELFDLEALVWAWVPAGVAPPALAGPFFCRTFPTTTADGGRA